MKLFGETGEGVAVTLSPEARRSIALHCAVLQAQVYPTMSVLSMADEFDDWLKGKEDPDGETD